MRKNVQFIIVYEVNTLFFISLSKKRFVNPNSAFSLEWNAFFIEISFKKFQVLSVYRKHIKRVTIYHIKCFQPPNFAEYRVLWEGEE